MTVKELRKRTGLSQSKFANKFGMPPINISHWEQEVRKPPEYVTYMMKRILDLEAENEVLRNGTRKEE
jgi:putative transcriptional regulator